MASPETVQSSFSPGTDTDRQVPEAMWSSPIHGIDTDWQSLPEPVMSSLIPGIDRLYGPHLSLA